MEIKVLSPGLIDESLLDKINKLLRQLNPEQASLTFERLNDIAVQPHVKVLLAFKGKELVGMLTAGFFHLPSKKTMYIEDVVVDESFRRQGIGRELSKTAIAMAEELEAEAVDLTSRPFREAAHKLYESLGFEKRDTHAYRLKPQRKK